VIGDFLTTRIGASDRFPGLEGHLRGACASCRQRYGIGWGTNRVVAPDLASFRSLGTSEGVRAYTATPFARMGLRPRSDSSRNWARSGLLSTQATSSRSKNRRNRDCPSRSAWTAATSVVESIDVVEPDALRSLPVRVFRKRVGPRYSQGLGGSIRSRNDLHARFERWYPGRFVNRNRRATLHSKRPAFSCSPCRPFAAAMVK
jgi:hypothetical protein